MTPRQLRRVERDARYIPATASAVSRVLVQLSNPQTQQRLLDTIRQWRRQEEEEEEAITSTTTALKNHHGPALFGGGDGQVLLDQQHVPLVVDQASIASLIEKRLTQAIQNAEESRKPVKRRAPSGGGDGLSKKGRKKSKEEETYGDLEDQKEEIEDNDNDNDDDEVDHSSREKENDNASYRSPAPDGLSKKGRKKSKEEETYGDLEDQKEEIEDDVDSSREEENDNASYRSPAPAGLSKKGRKKSKEEEGYGDLEDQKEDDVDSSREEENDNASYRSESEQLLTEENPASRQSQSFRQDSDTSVSSVEQESVGKRLGNVLAAKISAKSEQVESDDEWW